MQTSVGPSALGSVDEGLSVKSIPTFLFGKKQGFEGTDQLFLSLSRQSRRTFSMVHARSSVCLMALKSG
jgi:hypothetical protein